MTMPSADRVVFIFAFIFLVYVDDTLCVMFKRGLTIPAD